jgi:hypothetical protein
VPVRLEAVSNWRLFSTKLVQSVAVQPVDSFLQQPGSVLSITTVTKSSGTAAEALDSSEE